MKSRLTTLSILGAGLTFASTASAVVLATTDFAGRTVPAAPGLTVTNIIWTTDPGILNPGSLTAINELPNSLPGIFNTASAQGHFAPDKNLATEGPWSVDIPLNFAAGTASITVTDVVVDWQHFNNAGAFQNPTINRNTTWTVDVIGSTSGSVATGAANTGTGGSGILNVPLGATPSLASSETWKINLRADAVAPATGNNTGIDALTINGTVTPIPEPSAALLLGLGALGLAARRRRA